MAIMLITATGREIPCAAITPGKMYPVLHIHTSALDGASAWQVFSNPAETETITVVRTESMPPEEDGGEPRQSEAIEHYSGYTKLQSIGQSPFVTGALLVWLQRPADNSEGA